jgi:hypothetical protein
VVSIAKLRFLIPGFPIRLVARDYRAWFGKRSTNEAAMHTECANRNFLLALIPLNCTNLERYRKAEAASAAKNKIRHANKSRKRLFFERLWQDSVSMKR